MDIGLQLLEIFLLGAIGGAVPGPIMTSVFAEIVHGGLVNGVRVVFRALGAEIAVAGFILLGASVVGLPAPVLSIITLLGAAYLVYLARGVWKIDKIETEGAQLFTLEKIFTMTLLNGGFIVFWLTVCVPQALALDKVLAGGAILFLVIFEMGWLASMSVLALAFSRFRPILLKKGLIRPVFRLFALMLVYFAAQAVYGLVG